MEDAVKLKKQLTRTRVFVFVLLDSVFYFSFSPMFKCLKLTDRQH